MPVPSGWTGSLLEWAKAVAGSKVIPVPRSLKGRLAAWVSFSGAAKSRPVPGATMLNRRLVAHGRGLGVKPRPVPVGPAASDRAYSDSLGDLPCR